MSSLNLESVAFVTSLGLAAASIYLALLSFNLADPAMRKLAVLFGACFFTGGMVLAIFYLLFGLISQKLKKI